MRPRLKQQPKPGRQTYATAINGTYTMNSKMSLDLAVNQDFVSADQFQSYREWSTPGLAELSFLGPVQHRHSGWGWATTTWMPAPTCFSNNIRAGSNGGRRTRSVFNFMAGWKIASFYSGNYSDIP